MKGKARKLREHVRAEREAILLGGDAFRTEYMRRVRCGTGNSPGFDDSAIYNAEVRRLRYSQGGLHDRLKEAAKRVYHQSQAPYPTEHHMFRCFIGYRRSYMGEC